MKSEYLNNKDFESVIDRFQRSKRATVRYGLIIDDLQTTINRKSVKDLDTNLEEEKLKLNEQVFLQTKQEFRDMEQLLAQAFLTLSENLVRFAKFHLIDADDALQEGVMICFEKIDRFDPKKGKAFNYMTTCVLNHYRQLYRSARNYNELKKKYHEFLNLCENKIIIKNGREIPIYSS